VALLQRLGSKDYWLFPRMLQEAARCVLTNTKPNDPDYSWDPAWIAFYENLRASEEFHLAVCRVDGTKLARELVEIMDFDPRVLRAELELEFRDLMAGDDQSSLEDGFLDFPSKQRKLLSLLKGNGNVPIAKVNQLLYGRTGSIDSLLKLKKDTNRNLA